MLLFFLRFSQIFSEKGLMLYDYNVKIIVQREYLMRKILHYG